MEKNYPREKIHTHMKVEVFRAEFNQVILILENIHSCDSENN
jgi:hypothetical protein